MIYVAVSEHREFMSEVEEILSLIRGSTVSKHEDWRNVIADARRVLDLSEPYIMRSLPL